MSDLLERVRLDALNLSEEERGILAHDLLASLEPEDPGADRAWEVEIARRLAEIHSGEEKGHQVEQVFNEIRTKYGAR